MVRQALVFVNDTIDALQEDESACPLGCDTFLLGALVKTLRRHKLIWPRPPKPFTGISFVGVAESVEQAQVQMSQLAPGLLLTTPTHIQNLGKRKSPNAKPRQALTPESTPDASPVARASPDTHECDATTDLTERLGGLEADFDGLPLESKLGFCLY